MFCVVRGPFRENIHVLMQRAGYAAHRATDEISYTKRLGSERYPRFHVYPEDTSGGLRINLHLDMKQHTYEGFNRHQGEYDSSLVRNELERIHLFLESQTAATTSNSDKKSPEKGWFSRWFG